MHRHRDLCERAVDPLEIAAGLEAHGITDRTAARFRAPGRLLPRGGDVRPRLPRRGRTRAPDARRPRGCVRTGFSSTLLPGRAVHRRRDRRAPHSRPVAPVRRGSRHPRRGPGPPRGPPPRPPEQRRPHLPRQNHPLDLLARRLRPPRRRPASQRRRRRPRRPPTGDRRGPLAPHRRPCPGPRPGLRARGLDAPTSSPRAPAAGSRPAGAWRTSPPPYDPSCSAYSPSSSAPWRPCSPWRGTVLGEPAAYPQALALGALLFLARLLTVHGFAYAPAVVLTAAATAEAAALATVFAARLPGCRLPGHPRGDPRRPSGARPASPPSPAAARPWPS